MFARKNRAKMELFSTLFWKQKMAGRWAKLGVFLQGQTCVGLSNIGIAVG
jgi:hypothetical protein